MLVILGNLRKLTWRRSTGKSPFKFTKTTHQLWPCHVILASNSENFYFSPNSELNLGKVTKSGGNRLKNKNVTGKKEIGGWNPPPPPPPPMREYKLPLTRIETFHTAVLSEYTTNCIFANQKY